MTRVVLIDKLRVDVWGLQPNVRGSFCDEDGRLLSDGKLIYCARCLEKIHLATWNPPSVVQARLAEFTERHEDCR